MLEFFCFIQRITTMRLTEHFFTVSSSDPYTQIWICYLGSPNLCEINYDCVCIKNSQDSLLVFSISFITPNDYSPIIRVLNLPSIADQRRIISSIFLSDFIFGFVYSLSLLFKYILMFLHNGLKILLLIVFNILFSNYFLNSHFILLL